MKRLLLVFAISCSLLVGLVQPVSAVTLEGPGNRIAGIDVSRWQHPNGAAIDFKKMYSAGVRFVLIKGADAQTAADNLAYKYLVQDRKAAQSAKMYTGFYYYAYLPDSVDQAFITNDALAQAKKVIWRIGQIGGYNRRDLPVALDFENNCMRYSGSTCVRYMPRNLVTLWAKTWLAEVSAKTGRKPFLYSYAQFLETAMAPAPELRQYPLWMARYSLDPATSTNNPNLKKFGCFAHPWTNANCTAQWSIWQYSSCGIAGKYGVPGTRVDLNVFNGSSSKFLSLIRGTWVPDTADLLPSNEATTIQIVSQSSASTNDAVTIVVDVLRPDGSPVVTGDVGYKPLDSLMPVLSQSSNRSATGRWTIALKGPTAGSNLGLVTYQDLSGTHASNEFPVQFDVTQGPTPTATPTPTKQPAPAVDTCAGQIRN